MFKTMYRKFLLLCLLLTTSLFSYCKSTDVSGYKLDTQDKQAAAIPESLLEKLRENPEKELPNLVKSLTKGTKDPYLKVKRFFDWISLNTEYDLEGFRKNTIKYNALPYIECLKSGRAVCEGYADLFYQMCRIAKIEVVKIVGYSRGLGYNVFNERQNISNNHKWNALKIKEKWLLVDPTWGAGYVENGKYHSRYSSFFLFAKPEELAYTHFPQDSRFQFVKKPLSKEQFINQVFLNHLYFSSGTKMHKTYHNGYSIKDPSFKLTFKVPQQGDVVLVCRNVRGEQIQDNVFIQREKNNLAAEIRFPKRGRYVIHIFTGTRDNPEKALAGSLMVYAQKSNKNKFPLLYSDYASRACYLQAPKKLALSRGRDYVVKIRMPKATKGMLLLGKKQLPMTQKGDFFSTTVNSKRKAKLVLFGKFPDQEQFTGIAQFEVK